MDDVCFLWVTLVQLELRSLRHLGGLGGHGWDVAELVALLNTLEGLEALLEALLRVPECYRPRQGVAQMGHAGVRQVLREGRRRVSFHHAGAAAHARRRAGRGRLGLCGGRVVGGGRDELVRVKIRGVDRSGNDDGGYGFTETVKKSQGSRGAPA